MENEKIENKLVYRLAYQGVYGRNRKVKYDSTRLVAVPAGEPLDPETLRPRVAEVLAEVKLKPGGRWLLSEDPVEVREYDVDGRPVRIESYMIYSGRTVMTGEV